MCVYIYMYIYIYGERVLDIQSAQISQKQDWCNINAIMKKVVPPGYHQNGFVDLYI